MKLLTIATFGQLAEAHMAKNLLEVEGIQVFLAEEQTATVETMPHIRPGSSPKLQVPEDQAKRATELLQAVKKSES
jgi:hypothetical protein